MNSIYANNNPYSDDEWVRKFFSGPEETCISVAGSGYLERRRFDPNERNDPKEIRYNISKIYKSDREHWGLTIAELSAKSGVPVAVIEELEATGNIADKEQLVPLSDALRSAGISYRRCIEMAEQEEALLEKEAALAISRI
jgi:ribosome-binding protein aMBF1 (putative translation factor)